MVTIATADYWINIITLVIAYLILAGLGGFFQAWVALKMGDDTAAEAGFLTLDPVRHIDWVAFSSDVF
jgi:hypothetical protein